MKFCFASVHEIVEFLRHFCRYVFVVGIFLVATFYSLQIAKDDVGKNTKKKTSGEEQLVARTPDLGTEVPEKVYVGLLSTQAGDYYRVIVRAEATEDTTIDVYARSIIGIEKKVGSIVIKPGLLMPYEIAFGVDGMYRDIVLKRATIPSKSSSQWDGGEVFVSTVSVTRLDVSFDFELEKLKPTIFGNVTSSLFVLPPTVSGEVDRSLLSGSKSVGEYFSPEVSAISAVHIKPSVVGTGGAGAYEVNISEYDEAGSAEIKTVAKLEFTADKLWKYADKEKSGLSRFDLPVILDKTKLYFVSISAKNVVSDKKNGLELVRFGTDEEGNGGGMIALGTVSYTEVEQGGIGARILSGGMIQDIGSSYLYEYQMNHTNQDLLDIYGSFKKVKYNEDLKIITIPETDGASLTYKIDTLYPFVKMNVQMVGMKDMKRDGFQVEYSFDEKTWKSVFSEDESDVNQEANFFIDGQGSKATVFVKAIYRGEAQKNDVLSVSDFRVSAMLKK